MYEPTTSIVCNETYAFTCEQISEDNKQAVIEYTIKINMDLFMLETDDDNNNNNITDIDKNGNCESIKLTHEWECVCVCMYVCGRRNLYFVLSMSTWDWLFSTKWVCIGQIES